MRRLDAKAVVVDQRKIVQYLLCTTHREGRGKALWFMRQGFAADAWADLAAALRMHARTGNLAKVEETRFGTRYIVEGAMVCPDGRRPGLRSVWFVEKEGQAPRLVTAYPMETTDDDR